MSKSSYLFGLRFLICQRKGKAVQQYTFQGQVVQSSEFAIIQEACPMQTCNSPQAMTIKSRQGIKNLRKICSQLLISRKHHQSYMLFLTNHYHLFVFLPLTSAVLSISVIEKPRIQFRKPVLLVKIQRTTPFI